jgi:hypothetical protein
MPLSSSWPAGVAGGEEAQAVLRLGPARCKASVVDARVYGHAARACTVVSSVRVLLRAVLLRPPHPARGRCGEFDGRPICFFGTGGVSFAAFCALQQWSFGKQSF